MFNIFKSNETIFFESARDGNLKALEKTLGKVDINKKVRQPHLTVLQLDSLEAYIVCSVFSIATLSFFGNRRKQEIRETKRNKITRRDRVEIE